jgi:diaminopimelate epimerase
VGKMNKKMKKYKVNILRPGGNDTALVEGIVGKNRRKAINDKLIKLYPNVEQVGFYTYDRIKSLASLEMAGGEFCGNALRSLAFLLLDGKKGQLTFKVSGTRKLLKAGINKDSSFAEIPFSGKSSSVKQLNKNLWLVDLEGISHLIQKIPEQLDQNEAKKKAKILLNKYDLLKTRSASGVMFVYKDGSDFAISPVVWVRDIQTFFYETACASGTAAVGLWNFYLNKETALTLKVKQPTNSFIKFNVQKADGVLRIVISGKTENIAEFKEDF